MSPGPRGARAAAVPTDAGGNPIPNNPPNTYPFQQLTGAQIAAVSAALQLISDVSGLTFTRVDDGGGYSDNATMLFSRYKANDGAGAYASYPGSAAASSAAGDVRLNDGSVSTSSLPNGSYSFAAILHEIGHAIGLSHPGSYNAGPGQTITYANNAQFTEDSDQYSLMSYFDEANTGAQFFGHPESPMLFDVYAVQQIYGANAATRAGNTIYGYNSNAGGIYDFATNTIAAFTIWDGGGIDTIDASGSTADARSTSTKAASRRSIAQSRMSRSRSACIENAIGGSGNDTITGNGAANVLRGNGGTDGIDGGQGADAALYAGTRSSYLVRSSFAAGIFTISVVDTTGTDGSDTLASIETLGFNGGSAALRAGRNSTEPLIQFRRWALGRRRHPQQCRWLGVLP